MPYYKDNDPPKHFNASELGMWNNPPKNRSFLSKAIYKLKHPKEVFVSWEDYTDLIKMGAKPAMTPNRVYRLTRKRYKAFNELMQQLKKWREEQNVQNQDEPGIE